MRCEHKITSRGGYGFLRQCSRPATDIATDGKTNVCAWHRWIIVPCVCGSPARVIRGRGMAGEGGWKIAAQCGNSLFSAKDGRRELVESWNRWGHKTGCRRRVQM